VKPNRPIARDALGLGLRPSHYAALREGPPVAVDFFEILSENYLGVSDLPRQVLSRVAAEYPIVAHGVSLDVLGPEPLDEGTLSRLRALVERHGVPFVTDHLCWSASGGVRHHDLLPFPCASDLVPYAAARIRAVQEHLGVPFGVENVSTYLRFEREDLTEWEFLTRVLEAADCGLLLDINNLWVSSQNHGFDPHAYLDAIPWERVLYVHLAGHEVRPDGLLHDTHDRPVIDAVWDLYAEAWQRGGPFPTVLEWDDQIPPLEAVLRELGRAAEVRS
jgi:uncharacterized protein (UPF0276 family)